MSVRVLPDLSGRGVLLLADGQALSLLGTFLIVLPVVGGGGSLPAHSLSLTINEALASPPEKAMAPHSSTLAWKIPWAEEPGGLQSMGS